MPGPFPGMDPWLEAPDVWTGFHSHLITCCVMQLQPQLRQRGYYIDSNERVWFEDTDRQVVPDAALFAKERPHRAEARSNLLELDEPVRIRTIASEMRESFAEIFSREGNRLVTCIEFLSPSNKRPGVGRRLYQQKQSDLGSAGVHLVEIDLLRTGSHVLEIPEGIVASLRPWDYLANLVRRGGPDFEIYPIGLRERLPRIRIPLKLADSDAVLDLQEAVNQAYDIGPCPDRLEYDQAPIPPLNSEDAAWADGILKHAGRRK